jgi:hypothetical protein
VLSRPGCSASWPPPWLGRRCRAQHRALNMPPDRFPGWSPPCKTARSSS